MDMSQILIDIEKKLEVVCDKLNEHLSKDYTFYEVEFLGKKYNFERPTTPEESEVFEQTKHEFIKAILEQYLQSVSQIALDYYDSHKWTEDDEQSESVEEERFFKVLKACENIAIFDKIALSREDVQSQISADDYGQAQEHAVSGERKSIPLNLDSLYPNMQRPDWTQEKQEEFIKKGE